MIFNDSNLMVKFVALNKYYHENGTFNVNGRPFSALSYKIKGNSTFIVNDNVYNVNAGDFIFLPANVNYSVTYKDNCESITFHLFDCSYDLVETYSFNVLNLLEDALISVANDKSQSNNKKVFYDVMVKLSKQQKTNFDDSFAKCVNYIEGNFTDNDLSVPKLCQLFGYSNSGLYRSFYRYFNLSPNQYVLLKKLNFAKDLLFTEKLTVKEVASSCGFEDEKYFSRIFKKYFGLAPSRYIK